MNPFTYQPQQPPPPPEQSVYESGPSSSSNPSSNRLYPTNTYDHNVSGGYESSDIEGKPFARRDGGNGNSGKRKKKGGDSGLDDKIKKTRQSQSCDACRARKVKCDRPPPGSSNSTSTHRDVCSHCEHLGLTCTFDYKPKKRGPPNMYMRKMQGEPDSAADSPPPSEHHSPERPSAASTTLAPGMPDLSYPALAKAEPPHNLPEVKGWEPTLASAEMNAHRPLEQSHYPPQPPAHLAQAQAHQHLLHPSYTDITRSATSSPDHNRQFSTLPPQHSQQPTLPPSYMWSSSARFSGYPNVGSSVNNSPYNSPQHNDQLTLNSTYPTPITSNSPRYRPPPSISSSTTTNTNTTSKPLYIYVEHSYNPNNPIEKIMSRKTLYEIIDLYFDYIYPLIPCLHRPSFTHDLNIKREERQNEEEWTSLVLAIVASTLVQLPRTFVKMSRKQVKDLIIICHKRVREYMGSDFETITINRTIVGYQCLFILRMMSGISVGKGCFGALYAYHVALKAHEEKTYSLLNPLDRIFLRRSFWLAYGADMSIASVEATPVFFHEDDCADVAFPEEIDDEFISEQGYLPQPEGYTPILSGFNYISRLHRITGQVLDKHRRDKRKPPSGLLLQMRLNEVNELYERTVTLMDNCPKPLRLEYRTGTKSVQSLSPGWDTKAKNDIMAIFSDPNYDTEIIKDHYLVQQANIYVTQQQVRFMILQYRDELHELQLDQERSNIQNSSGDRYGNINNIQPWIRRGSNEKNNNQSGNNKEKEEILVTSSAEKDEVICDLLAILQKIPLQVLAANSFPIVAKVQFVASTLLDAIEPSGGQPGLNPQNQNMIPTVLETRAQKAQRNLWQFLNILSEIEGLYSLEDD